MLVIFNSKTLYEKLTQFLIDGYLNKVRYCFPPPHCILLRGFLFIILKVWFALRLRRSSLDWDADEGLGAGSQQFDLLGGGGDPVQPLAVLFHHRVPARRISIFFFANAVEWLEANQPMQTQFTCTWSWTGRAWVFPSPSDSEGSPPSAVGWSTSPASWWTLSPRQSSCPVGTTVLAKQSSVKYRVEHSRSEIHIKKIW